MKSVLYPGSFDPITNGHLDIIERSSRMFDKVLVGVALNDDKTAFFSTLERVELIKHACEGIENVEVISFDGLLVEAVKKLKVSAVIRGLRAVSDFEYEFQMALMNRELNEDCETLFMMPSPAYMFVSSRMIREIDKLDGDISAFVPAFVIKALKEKRESMNSKT